MDAVKIGAKLEKLRGSRTQAEVASACQLTKQAICMYETGARIPMDDIKIKLANYYGVSVEELFYAE